MIALVLSAITSLFLFLVLGILLEKISGFRATMIDKILVGIVLSNSLTSIVSLFSPVNTNTLFFFLAFSVLLLFFLKPSVRVFCNSIKRNRKVLLISFPFMLVALLVSIIAPQNYDTGLYHFQSIKWIEEYPVVPGLANLHSRFGFNPNVFTLSALTSFSGLFGQEIFSLNFTLFSVLTVYFVGTLQKIAVNNGINNLFVLHLILFLFMMDDLSGHLPSPSPDFFIQVIPLYVFSRMIMENRVGEKFGFSVILPVVLLCIYTVTVKLSALPLLLLVVVLIWNSRPPKREWLAIISLSILILIPWIIRNIILTGWLIYPLYQVDLFTFDWKVPATDLVSVSNAIKVWARSPENHVMAVAGMKIHGWFPEWWYNQNIPIKALFSAALLSPLLLSIGYFSGRVKTGFIKIAVILVSFLGVLFWLFLAPDFRFGKAFILFSAFSPLILFTFCIRKQLIPYLSPVVIVLMVVILMLNYSASHYVGPEISRVFRENSKRILLPENMVIPGEVKFNTKNLNGYQIYVPSEGDRCFNQHLPCTPSLDSTVVLRNNTLESGFRRSKLSDFTLQHL